jgi:hypothetical protein
VSFKLDCLYELHARENVVTCAKAARERVWRSKVPGDSVLFHLDCLHLAILQKEGSPTTARSSGRMH